MQIPVLNEISVAIKLHCSTRLKYQHLICWPPLQSNHQSLYHLQFNLLNFTFLSPPSSSSSLIKLSPWLFHQLCSQPARFLYLIFQVLHLRCQETPPLQLLVPDSCSFEAHIITRHSYPFSPRWNHTQFSIGQAGEALVSRRGHLSFPVQSSFGLFQKFKRTSIGTDRRSKVRKNGSKSVRRKPKCWKSILLWPRDPLRLHFLPTAVCDFWRSVTRVLHGMHNNYQLRCINYHWHLSDL